MNFKRKLLIVAIALSGIIGTVAIAQSTIHKQVEQDKQHEDEKIIIEIKNGVKKVTVTKIVDGKEIVKIYKGEEADAFLEEHNTFGKQHSHFHHSMGNDSSHHMKVIEHMDFSGMDSLGETIMKEIHSAMNEIDITINGEDFSWFSDCENKDDKKCDIKILMDSNMNQFHAEMKKLHEVLESIDIDVEVEEEGNKVIRKIVIVTDKEEEKTTDKTKTDEIMKVYPNPSSGKFKVEVMGKEGVTTKLSVVDIKGRVVFSKELEGVGKFTETVNLKNEAPGNYIVTIEQGGEILKQKIQIEK